MTSRDPDEDVCYEIMRQKRADSESIPIHQKVGTVVPFSRTVDRDPNPRIPLSVTDYRPVLMIEAAAWAVVALAVGLIYWWVAA